MRFSLFVSLTRLLSAASVVSAVTVFSNVTIFDPPANYTIPRTLYARTLLLDQNCEQDNVLLATWENYSPEPPYFPIYQSDDLGQSWHEIARVTDQVNGWGLRYQPFLYELAEPIGNFSAGTVLLAGNSIPANLSETQVDLYASVDKGVNWKFVSHVAHGGRAIPNNGETPVWEPFLMAYEGKIVCYYSDQRDPTAGQKLVHQISSDLYHWEEPVDDVKYSTYDWRPGMTTVAQMPFGQYIMTYEFYGADEGAFSVYYRISTDPLNFNASEGHVIRATDGAIPVSSPYVVWADVGGPLGTVAVSCGTDTAIYLNHNLGVPDAWTRVSTPEDTSYTRNLRVLPGQQDLLITGAGVLNGSNNSVMTGVVDISPRAPTYAQCNTLRRMPRGVHR